MARKKFFEALERSKRYKQNRIVKEVLICQEKFIDLQRHAHNVVRFFYSEHPYEHHFDAAWFELASGITNVNYTSNIFDIDVYWCDPAVQNKLMKTDFHSTLITELIRFSFIWGGLESILNNCSLPKYSGRTDGKIKRLNYFLSINYVNKHPIPDGYEEAVSLLKMLLKYSKSHPNQDTQSFFQADESCVQKLAGLKAVYKIRNLFAHGASRFNEIQYSSQCDMSFHNDLLEIQIIQTSSRIVLFTIQMLLTLTSDNLNFLVTKQHEYLSENGVNAYTFLKNMHLQSFKYC